MGWLEAQMSYGSQLTGRWIFGPTNLAGCPRTGAEQLVGRVRFQNCVTDKMMAAKTAAAAI